MNNFKILALDQATKITGYSIFTNGKLKKYGTLVVDVEEKNPIERMRQMDSELRKLIHKINPDYIVFENVQFQKNRGTFKTLSQMQGILMGICFELNMGFTIIEPSAWKSFCGINGKNRKEQKKDTQRFVKEKYKLELDEDCSDAIGIGQWSIHHIKEVK